MSALPPSCRAALPVLTKVSDEDEDKLHGRQENGELNLRRVPKMVASPEVEQIGPN